LNKHASSSSEIGAYSARSLSAYRAGGERPVVQTDQGQRQLGDQSTGGVGSANTVAGLAGDPKPDASR
jgi:hypothetical protein